MRFPEGIRRLFHLRDVHHGVRRDVDEELRHHFESVERELRARGLPPSEAAKQAQERFGDIEAYRRRLERIDLGRVRMNRGNEIIDTSLRAAALALRGLRRAPGFTFAVTTILALGIGANAVMFGVVDRLLLSPPKHIVQADQVRRAYLRRDVSNGRTITSETFTFPDYTDLTVVSGFANVAAYTFSNDMIVGRGEGAGSARVVRATSSFFPTLGVQPALGRFYGPDDDALGATPVTVLSREFWERRFGADPDILGRTLDIGAGSYTVIGIAPAGFTGVGLAPVDVWLPLIRAQEIEVGRDVGGTSWQEHRNWWWIRVVARLSPRVDAVAGEAEATTAHRSGRQRMIDAGDYDENASILLGPVIAARGPQPGREARVTRWLAGVSLVVLLIACFNVANLLLAREVKRRREVAVRVALGIGRGRLLVELLTESLVLALLGGLSALALAYFGGGALQRALLPDIAFAEPGLGGRLLGFTAVMTVLTGLLSAALPALRASRTDVSDALKNGSPGSGGSRSGTRSGLMVAQAAFSVVLLVGAGLFVRSLREAETLDLGFDPKRVAVVDLDWNGAIPERDQEAVYFEAARLAQSLPGVHSAGLTSVIPFRSSRSIGKPRVPGLDSIPDHPDGGPYVNKVTSGYFEAMGISILRGRGFSSMDDREDAPPTAVVGENMARAIWPDGNALGQCMFFETEEDGAPPCTEVVGIAEDARRQELVEDNPDFMYYLNWSHPAFGGAPRALMVGTVGDAGESLADIRRSLSTVSSQIRFVGGNTLQGNIEPQMRSWKLGAAMFTVFGLLALVVAGWGLYSVLAFDVSRRRRELGIRSALGADVSRLVRLVATRVIVLVSAGIAVGLGACLVGARWLEPLLFGVSAVDPVVYGGVVGVLLAAAAVAGVYPAWRATRVDPTEALRAE